MNFVLFVALNAVLLIRPEELLPDIAGLRLYLIVIVGCLLTTGTRLLETLSPDELAERPITVCVLGVWAAGILSQLARGQFGVAFDFAGEFGKVVLYYLLLISTLDSVSRFRAFLGWIVAFVVVIATLGLLQYHGLIDVEALRPFERREGIDPETGERGIILQLRGTGIYNDPNDLCLILVTGSFGALYRSQTAGSRPGRLTWLAPIGLFAYALTLTQSRGGLLGLLIAAFAWGYGRFGWKKTLLLGVVLGPVAIVLAGGRQANISLSNDDTGHSRVALWSDGFAAMMRNPITGIGVQEYADEAGHVAHNSFVHAYVEMGLIGGALFLGAFCLSVVGLHQASTIHNSAILRLQPFVLAIVVGYAGGIFSLSRNYVVPTYMVLGLADAYLALERPALPTWFRFNQRLMGRFVILGIVGFVGLKVLTQVFMSLGG